MCPSCQQLSPSMSVSHHTSCTFLLAGGCTFSVQRLTARNILKSAECLENKKIQAGSNVFYRLAQQLTLNNSKEMKKGETALDTFCKWKTLYLFSPAILCHRLLSTLLPATVKISIRFKSFSHKQQRNTNANSFYSSIYVSSFPPNTVSYRIEGGGSAIVAFIVLFKDYLT